MKIFHTPPSRMAIDSGGQPAAVSAETRLAALVGPAVTSRAIEPRAGTLPTKPEPPPVGGVVPPPAPTFTVWAAAAELPSAAQVDAGGLPVSLMKTVTRTWPPVPLKAALAEALPLVVVVQVGA